MVQHLEGFDLFGEVLDEGLSGMQLRLAEFVKIDSLLVPSCDSDVVGGSDIDLVDGDYRDWRLIFAFHGCVGPSSHIVSTSTCLLQSSY